MKLFVEKKILVEKFISLTFCLDTKSNKKVKKEMIYNTFLSFALIKLLHYCKLIYLTLAADCFSLY